MKKLLISLISIISLAFSSPSLAKGETQAFWILVPLAITVGQCTQYGDETRNRFQSAIRIAKENSADLLPPAAWAMIEQYQNSSGSLAPTPELQRACVKAIEGFSSPTFPTQVRHLVATYFIAATATDCILTQPTTAQQIKQAWVSVGVRNGFEISEKAIDALVENQRKPLEANRTPPRSIEGCVKAANHWATPHFDQTFSKDAVFKLFGGQ